MAALSDADLLARLVSFDTTSRNPNLPLARFLADYLDRPGVVVRELPGPGGPERGKANLFVRVGPPLDPDAGERPGLVLSGHMDVVPADDLDRWTSDPFELTDRGDRWVARGSADMKGFLALAANLLREQDPTRLRRPLVLLFTYDEEVGCLGAGHLRRTWGAAEGTGEGLPRAAVIGEPTELRPVRIHKGHLKLRLEYPGVSAHSAYPHLGVNAIEGAAEGVRALVGLKEELMRERVAASEHFPQVPFAALNVGTVHGGVAVNVVPDRCALELGVRLLPGMDAEEVVERVLAATGASRDRSDRREPRGTPPAAEGVRPRGTRGAPSPSREEARPVLSVLSVSPPLMTSDGTGVVEALLEATGEAEAGAVSYATDAGWLAEMGMDCAIWGPGSIEVAHKPDEFLPKGELARARELLGGIVERFCVAEGA